MRADRPWTLRTRLVLVLLLLGTLGLGIFGVASVVLIRQSMISRMDDQLRDLSRRMDHPPPPPPDSDQRGRRTDGLPTDFALRLLALDGSPERGDTSTGPSLPVLNASTVGQYSGRPFFADDKQAGAPWRVLVSTRNTSDGGILSPRIRCGLSFVSLKPNHELPTWQ